MILKQVAEINIHFQGIETSFLGFNLEDQTARIYSSGMRPFNATKRSTIGKAIALALQSESAENRYLYIADITTTQSEILSILEQQSGKRWSVIEKDIAMEREEGLGKLAKKDFSGIGHLILADLFGDGEGTVDRSALHNEILGLDFMRPEKAIAEEVVRYWTSRIAIGN